MGGSSGIENYGTVIKEIRGMRKGAETCIKRTMSDMRTRVPGWVATEVAAVYGIKKGEITPSKAGKGGKKAGGVHVRGETTLGKVKKLTKKQRKQIGKNLRRQGTKSSDHSPIMLLGNGGGGSIPFQRKSTNRKDLEVIKTVSLPQMVSSDRTKDNIERAINEGLEKRLQQNLKLILK